MNKINIKEEDIEYDNVNTKGNITSIDMDTEIDNDNPNDDLEKGNDTIITLN